MLPTWIKSAGEKEKRGKEKEGREKENRGRRKKRGRKGKRERDNFSVFRRLKLDGPRIKVGPHSGSYVWVPKSVCFVKLKEVGVSPTLIIPCLRTIKWL